VTRREGACDVLFELECRRAVGSEWCCICMWLHGDQLTCMLGATCEPPLQRSRGARLQPRVAAQGLQGWCRTPS
jgi:hypothetical protein